MKIRPNLEKCEGVNNTAMLTLTFVINIASATKDA